MLDILREAEVKLSVLIPKVRQVKQDGLDGAAILQAEPREFFQPLQEARAVALREGGRVARHDSHLAEVGRGLAPPSSDIARRAGCPR